MILEFMMIYLLNWVMPEDEIDCGRNFNITAYLDDPKRYGNHEFRMNGNQISENTEDCIWSF
jgi:hypothetical protein